jgi:hypothetical protein
MIYAMAKKLKDNDALLNEQLANTAPYTVEAVLLGTTQIAFHNYNIEDIKAKQNAAKGSAIKKIDNLETFVYRSDAGNLAIPDRVLRATLVTAAKAFKHPSNVRSTLSPIMKASLEINRYYDLIQPDGKPYKTWEIEHQERVTVQRNFVSRTWPVLRKGWTLPMKISILQPEYITPDDFRKVLDRAGQFVGMCEFRPTKGRFRVDSYIVKPYEMLEDC